MDIICKYFTGQLSVTMLNIYNTEYTQIIFFFSY